MVQFSTYISKRLQIYKYRHVNCRSHNPRIPGTNFWPRFCWFFWENNLMIFRVFRLRPRDNYGRHHVSSKLWQVANLNLSWYIMMQPPPSSIYSYLPNHCSLTIGNYINRPGIPWTSHRAMAALLTKPVYSEQQTKLLKPVGLRGYSCW